MAREDSGGGSRLSRRLRLRWNGSPKVSASRPSYSLSRRVKLLRPLRSSQELISTACIRPTPSFALGAASCCVSGRYRCIK